MDRLRERLVVAEKALASLEQALASDLPPVERRDVAILRFIYSFEAVWKAGQLWLRDREAIEMAAPKGVIREIWKLGLLPDEGAEAALGMVHDRNLAVHTYDETLAADLMARLPSHAALLRQWLEALKNQR